MTRKTINETGVVLPAEGDAGGGAGGEPQPALVQDDLLLEEISIDGMCGVY